MPVISRFGCLPADLGQLRTVGADQEVALIEAVVKRRPRTGYDAMSPPAFRAPVRIVPGVIQPLPLQVGIGAWSTVARHPRVVRPSATDRIAFNLHRTG